MPKLPPPRVGEPLIIKGRILPFSFWPVYRSSRRYGIRAPRQFVSNPWLLICRSINDQLRSATPSLHNALAFADQGEDYLRVARGANLLAAKPVLLYYGLMNLAKAFIVTKKVRPLLDSAYHGLTTHYGPGGHEFLQSRLSITRSVPTKLNVFDDFATALGSGIPPSCVSYNVSQLLPQDLLGNQLYSIASRHPLRYFKL